MTDYTLWSRQQLIDKLQQQSQQHQKLSSKPPREFNFNHVSSRHIAIKLSYLGWDYNGLESQDHQSDLNTIESKLLDALFTAKLIPSKNDKVISLSKCGRTDKGVSSFTQIFALTIKSQKIHPEDPEYTPWKLRLDESLNHITQSTNPEDLKLQSNEICYVTTLNRLLPTDIKVYEWSPVPSSFDARFSCIGRKYNYFFPALNLDISAMKLAAAKLIGNHDFRFFHKFDKTKPNTLYQRTIHNASIEPLDPSAPIDSSSFYVFEVEGRAFLWHQVRCMMSVLYLVGMGVETPEVIDDLMDISKSPSNSGRPIYDMAPETPLVLIDCIYPPGTFNWQQGMTFKETGDDILEKSNILPSSTRKIMTPLFEMWREHATREKITRCLLKKLLPTDIEFSKEEWMREFYKGMDPIKGWTSMGLYKRGACKSFQGCTKSQYVPLMQRARGDAVKLGKRKLELELN